VQTESNRDKMPTIQEIFNFLKEKWPDFNAGSTLLYGYFCIQNHTEVSSNLMTPFSFTIYYCFEWDA
jgi:hypothetical protein